ncbi:hypothetical protein TNCV_1772701 [Trichonephila clavipes]|nr:hypothetical protein TNCV_1772701 [Trichonephila clavipes]
MTTIDRGKLLSDSTSYIFNAFEVDYSSLMQKNVHLLTITKIPIYVRQLPLEERGYLTDEEMVHEDILEPALPTVVCGKIEISTDINIEETSRETSFDATDKGTFYIGKTVQ